ncbi:MAG: Fatty acid oxidation complex subunit alpha [Phycisphaerae bacterium]|nr:Fatty acid oxidation complex subunit alpha [Phycisphaerae bacterium]
MPDMLDIVRDDDGVWTVRLDRAGASVNTFTPQTLDELDAALNRIEGDGAAAGVIFTSAKSGNFASGADLFAMREMDAQAMRRFIDAGQRVLSRVAALAVPTVAAINGDCLGGGLELGLACDWRVSADAGAIRIGLPESKLGILPAWGGTTRLSRTVGLSRALPALLTGRTFTPRQARSAGVVDELVRPEALHAAARRYVRLRPRRHRPGRLDRLAAAVPLLRAWALARALKRTLAKTHGHYPAAARIVEVVRAGLAGGVAVGLAAERDAVLALADTDACRNLMRLFFLRQTARRGGPPRAAEAPQVHEAAVVGGGTMGAGITHALAAAGIAVRLIEVSEQAASAALRRVRRLLDEDVRAGRMSGPEATAAMRRVSPATDWTGLRRVQFAIEAVAERLDVKRDVFERLGALTGPSAVMASNTSSLSIAALGEAAGDARRVVGLHFFNPVNRMPLVEVVRAKQSGEPAVAAAFALALAVGKTPVVVADAPGFVVNRVLIPYLAEAILMAGQGADIATVDEAMRRWGMPMGPFELLDRIGLDVAADIFGRAGGSLAEGATAPAGVEHAVARGWLGVKSGRGFYRYGRRRRVNRALPPLVWKNGQGAFSGDEEAIQRRLMGAMIEAGAQLLAEGVAESADAVDLATVLGLGLAPFRGGLMSYARDIGVWQEGAAAKDRLPVAGESDRRPSPDTRPASEKARTSWSS